MDDLGVKSMSCKASMLVFSSDIKTLHKKIHIIKLLEGKKTKIVLYTYDSILLDVAKEDIKVLLPKIKQELEADGFPTRMSIGENYGTLIKK